MKRRLVLIGLGLSALIVFGAAAVVLWPGALETYRLRGLERGDPEARRRAALALAETGSLRAVPILLRMPRIAGDPELERSEVLPPFENDLRLLGIWRAAQCHRREIVPVLLGALGDPDPRVRGVAARALAWGIAEEMRLEPSERESFGSDPVPGPHGELPPEWLPLFEKMLVDEDAEIRRCGLKNLPLFGPAAVPHLRGSLSHAEPSVRAAAIDALRRSDRGAAKESVPEVLALLGDPDEEVRLLSACFLVEVAPEREDVVSALRRALQDPDDGVRRIASDALRALPEAGPPGD